MMPVLRTSIPMLCFAKHGPHYVLPIPAPSGRPLTKGTLHQIVLVSGPGFTA